MTTFDVGTFILFALLTMMAFSLIMKEVRQRFGDFVANDLPTRAGILVLACTVVSGGMYVLALISGHLSGHL